MNANWNNADERVDRYVRGQMSESELQQFEELFLDDPQWIEMIELAQSLRHGLADNPGADSAVAIESKPHRAARSIWPDQLGFVPLSRWATAFSILTLVSIAQFVYFSHQIEQLQAPQANTPILLLGQVRGASDRDQPAGLLYLGDEIRWFSLELDLGWPLSPEYSMAIINETSGEVVAQVDQLRASPNETLLVTLPADSFKSGDYRLEVFAGDEAVTNYRVRVIRKQ